MPEAKLAATHSLIFNARLDAVVATIFLLLVVAIFAVSLREWLLVLLRKKAATLHESAPVWLPATVIESETRRRWWQLGPAVLLVGTLLRELSGEGAAERTDLPPAEALAQTLADRYDNPSNPTRCC